MLRDRQLPEGAIVIALAVVKIKAAREMRFGRVGLQFQSTRGILPGRLPLRRGRLVIVINPSVQDGEVGEGENKFGIELNRALIELLRLP